MWRPNKVTIDAVLGIEDFAGCCKRMLRYCASERLDAEAARDLLQESAAVLARDFHAKKLRDPEAYFWKVVRNQTSLYHARRIRAAQSPPLPEPVSNSYRGLEGPEKSTYLAELLNSSMLNKRNQRLLWLRLTGHSEQEIADALGIRPSSVRRLYSRAVHTLREHA